MAYFEALRIILCYLDFFKLLEHEKKNLQR